MGTRYSISVVINYEYNFRNIRMILEKGRDWGFSYNKLISLGKSLEVENGIECDLLPFTIEEVLEGLQKKEQEKNVFSITMSMEDAYTKILFNDVGGNLTITFMYMSPIWSTIHVDSDEEVDYQRYALFLIKFLEEFNILFIEIIKD